jgi:ERCC4-type nuclease
VVVRVVAGVHEQHEQPSGVPALLSAWGATVEVARLLAGDYGVGGGALVERKTRPSDVSIRSACVALTDLGITLLRSKDAADSALWLHRLADRRHTVRTTFRAPPAPSHSRSE